MLSIIGLVVIKQPIIIDVQITKQDINLASLFLVIMFVIIPINAVGDGKLIIQDIECSDGIDSIKIAPQYDSSNYSDLY